MLWLLHVKLERPEPYVARSCSRAINPGTKVVKNSVTPPSEGATDSWGSQTFVVVPESCNLVVPEGFKKLKASKSCCAVGIDSSGHGSTLCILLRCVVVVSTRLEAPV